MKKSFPATTGEAAEYTARLIDSIKNLVRDLRMLSVLTEHGL
jgi:hypothetical protein